MKKVLLFESEEAKNFFALATVGEDDKMHVTYFKFTVRHEEVTEWVPELKVFVPILSDYCAENKLHLWSY